MQRFDPTGCLYSMMTARRSLLTTICCLSLLVASAQMKEQPDADWTPALSSYRTVVGVNIPYNEGREFPGYGIKLDGHPFFATDQLTNGDIVYDGTLYTGIPMLYDLVADEVIVRAPENQYLIRLSREKVPQFAFRGEEFFRADPDSTGQRYYQSLYKGTVRVFAKKRKQLNHVTAAERAIDRFDPYDDYFILKDGEIHHVSSKGSVLNIFREQREELKKVIAQEDLSFRRDPETFLKRCATVHDQRSKK